LFHELTHRLFIKIEIKELFFGEFIAEYISLRTILNCTDKIDQTLLVDKYKTLCDEYKFAFLLATKINTDKILTKDKIEELKKVLKHKIDLINSENKVKFDILDNLN
jgi:hypothetical protein